MKKLLHERLRDHTNKLVGIDEVFEAEDCNNFFVMINKFADEIERYYIPLPCDPDGEPWKIGDEFETLDVHPRCEGYLLFEGEWYLRSQHSQEFKASRCKRPSPKVLDADGVEIKVGDTVWNLDDPKRSATVAQITKGIADHDVTFVYCVDDCGCAVFNKIPIRITHKEPVLDADGVPIREGDTVWDEDGKKLKVIELKPDTYRGFDQCEDLVDCGEYKYGCHVYRIARQLTHKEPDSLEKMRDDVGKWLTQYGTDTPYKAVKSIGNEIIDRLTAIMERDA